MARNSQLENLLTIEANQLAALTATRKLIAQARKTDKPVKRNNAAVHAEVDRDHYKRMMRLTSKA